MAPVEVHLKSFSNKLKFVPEPFRQNTRVSLRVRKLPPERVGRRSDDPLDLSEGFLIHGPT